LVKPALLVVLAALGASRLFAQATAPAVQAHYKQAQEALSRKDYDTAAEQFRAMLRLNPNLAEAHANLGTIEYVRGKYSEAAASFRAALKVKPSLATAETFLGMCEVRQGHVREALPHLVKGFWNSSFDEWRLQAGLMLFDQYNGTREFDKALEVVRALERGYPANPDVLYLAYRLHSDLGARAVAALVKAAPGSARLHQVTAELLESEGDFPKAVDQYRRALTIDPNLAGAHRALGVALMSSSTDEASRDEARKQFELELALNPNDGVSEYQLGEILWLGNKPDDALKHFSRAVELSPGFTNALIAAGKAWTAQDLPERAVTFLRKAVAIEPENEVAHYRLAQAYLKMGQKQQADEELAQFRKLRAALESLRSIYRQVQENRITAQTVE